MPVSPDARFGILPALGQQGRLQGMGHPEQSNG